MGGATIVDANAELTLRLRQQELTAEFASFSLQTDALQPVLDEACRIAARGMGCVLAKVLEFRPDENCFIMRAGIGWHPGVVGHARLGSDLGSPAGFAFQTGEPVLSNDLAVETRFRTPALLIDHGVRCAFNVLVHGPGQRFGVLEVDSPDQRDFTLADTAFLQTLAATLAHAIARQQRINELKRSHAFASGVLDASPDCVKVLSADGAIRFMNHNGLEMNALARLDEVGGQEFAAMWSEAGRNAIRHAVGEAIAGRRTRVEESCQTTGGTQRWWELSFGPFIGDADDAMQVIGVSRDVSERRATDQAIRDGERALRTLNETLEQRVEERTRERDHLWQLSEDLLVVAEYDGNLVRISPSWTRLLGYDEETLLRATYFGLIHPDEVGRVVALLDRMRRQERPVRYENRVAAADGSWRWISWVLSPEPGGRRLLGVGRDVTVEKAEAELRERLEEQLRQSQKMEAVGQLTGGLAHDFNNLLTGIAGSLELLARRIGQGRYVDCDRYITAAQGATTRAAALTHRLLAFSRRQTLEPRPTRGDALAADMTDLIRRTVGPSVEVETVSEPGLWCALCDPNQLENAVLNLCINARDAMQGGGRIRIETSNVTVDRHFAALRDMPVGQYMTISVTDTGTGMPPDVVARAFDPFFTTKPKGEGTGLGLSMVHGFANQSGGQVRIHSVEGVGTTVSIYLPRHQGEDAVEPAREDEAGPGRANAGETVLVVDDEPIVRMLVLEVLQDLGYAAIEAADAAAGLKVLQSDVRLDLLVTDVGLPGGMDGRQMAEAARVARPDLKVLFITGYAETPLSGEPAMQVLAKPFAMDVLAIRITDLITSR